VVHYRLPFLGFVTLNPSTLRFRMKKLGVERVP